MEGVHRFLARVWRLFEGGVSDEPASKEQLRLLHATIKKVRVLVWQICSLACSLWQRRQQGARSIGKRGQAPVGLSTRLR